jgi:phosphoribosylformylglycinamidine cyclo-ligase
MSSNESSNGPVGEASASEKLTYKSSGVDVEKADALVDWMKSEKDPSHAAHADRLVSGIGGFAALFRGDFKNMSDPLLVSSTDGIGTKLLMGLESGLTKGLAQDLVGMCVNDLLCTGAEPLFFLDYFATSKLDEVQLKEFITTLKNACAESGAALIGGETAELPGLYNKGHFDAAGFSVGVVDKDKAWSANKVKDGDVFLGLASSGFHSNGYSLLRKIFGEDGGDHAKALMEPTKLYWTLIKKIKDQGLDAEVRSCAHITGGGMDNLSRVLPKDLGVKIKTWEFPQIFKDAMSKGDLDKSEMFKTFNCGIGFGMVVSPDSKDKIIKLIEETPGQSLVTTGLVHKSDSSWSVE